MCDGELPTLQMWWIMCLRVLLQSILILQVFENKLKILLFLTYFSLTLILFYGDFAREIEEHHKHQMKKTKTRNSNKKFDAREKRVAKNS